MSLKIDRDNNRFRQIVRGKIRENLRRYVNHGEMIGRKGRDLVSIPLPQLDIPHFRYGQNGRGGVGQGDGQEGQPIARGDGEGDGTGQAGSDPGQHIVEVDVTLEELAEILGSELELPRIEPKTGHGHAETPVGLCDSGPGDAAVPAAAPGHRSDVDAPRGMRRDPLDERSPCLK